jgi:putative ABC transport system substrate-binding protein
VLAADADEAYPDPEAAAEAVRGWVEDDGADLIVALSSSGARIAADTAPETNVLFLSTDPMATGLVADEDAPEGRLTGVSFRVPADRTLSLLQRAVPDLERVGLAYPPDDPSALAHRDVVVLAADELDIELSLAEFTDGTDVGAAIAALAAEGIDALLVSTSPVATRALPETSTAATAAGLPVMANTTIADFTLLSLTADTEELGRQLGRQAARLLSGEDPSTVPVEDPNRFVLTLDNAVAARLGITFDPGLVREADDVLG